MHPHKHGLMVKCKSLTTACTIVTMTGIFHSYLGTLLGNRGPGGSQTDWLWQLREHYTS